MMKEMWMRFMMVVIRKGFGVSDIQT